CHKRTTRGNIVKSHKSEHSLKKDIYKDCIGQKTLEEPNVKLNDEDMEKVVNGDKIFVGSLEERQSGISRRENIIYRLRDIRTILIMHMIKLDKEKLIHQNLKDISFVIAI